MMLQLCLVLVMFSAVLSLKPCPGDTRGDQKCNHDSTHRVCAKIGDKDTSFFRFTHQDPWCNTKGSYRGPHGTDPRCPTGSEPTWCICKWATSRWIAGEGCNKSVEFDCEATDVCDLKATYSDFDVLLKPAHDCMKIKCKKQWDAC